MRDPKAAEKRKASHPMVSETLETSKAKATTQLLILLLLLVTIVITVSYYCYYC